MNLSSEAHDHLSCILVCALGVGHGVWCNNVVFAKLLEAGGGHTAICPARCCIDAHLAALDAHRILRC